MNLRKRSKNAERIHDLCVFAAFAAMMFASKKLMEFAPNVHLLGMFTMMLTVVYRVKALVPIYLYVLFQGIDAGFNLWWIPYIYIWTLLWGAAMLIPKRLPKSAKAVIYPVICSLHGFLFGILYAPAQMLLFDLELWQMPAWIASGALFDVAHGLSNFAFGLLILPLSELILKLEKGT